MIPSLRKHSGDDVVLRPVNLSHRRRLQVYGSIALVLVLVVVFLGGRFSAERAEVAAGEERAALAEQVRGLEKQLATAREELALHRTGSEVAHQAQEQVRRELRDLHEQQAELEEAVAFYKSVMDPGAGDEGLRIERLRLDGTGSPEQVEYRLVLAQVVEDRNFIQGSVEMTLLGKQDDEEVEITDAVGEGSSTSFRFRYFQELEGTLELPEGFTPREVRVVASGGGERAEDTFDWQVRE